jgi:CDP-glucose 4,6-dehydratase
VEYRQGFVEGVVGEMDFWKGKKVLVTGHTGFKGSWFSLWLKELGAEVIGYSLEPPTQPNLFTIAQISEGMVSIRGDIRNSEYLKKAVKKHKPEFVFHFAAQPLVRKSYASPIETFETNVIGTVNLLNAVRFSDNTRVVINVTSDKCYQNKEWVWGYRETDAIGGNDPYSCSKGCSELITNSFRKSFFDASGVAVASVRAGNVIGGGDWAEDRLVPDAIKALICDKQPIIRNPNAIRPWQYVLEPLKGYLILAEKMWKDSRRFSGAWNFGPEDENSITVKDLIGMLIKIWGDIPPNWCLDDNSNLYESNTLKLDCSKSKTYLGWKSVLGIEETLKRTVRWYAEYIDNQDMRNVTIDQIKSYEKLGSEKYE